MAFEAREISNHDGQIVSLYKFKWGDTIWRYTSADQDQTIDEGSGNVVYSAIAIGDDGMIQGGSSNNDLKVDVQSNIPLVDLFRSTPPAGSIWLTVRRRHLGDANDNWFVYWIGTVGNVKKGNATMANLICRTLLATFRRSGLRLAWTRGCPHMVYDTECRVDPEDFRTIANVTAVGAGVITVDAAGGHPAGYFDGGFMEWQATVEGTKDQRGIESSASATSFRIFGSTDRIVAGMAISLYPGCSLTAATCKDKFNNLANFGGMEQMTGDNPFDKNIF